MVKRNSFEPGQTIEVPNYPFVRFVFHGCDIDGPFLMMAGDLAARRRRLS